MRAVQGDSGEHMGVATAEQHIVSIGPERLYAASSHCFDYSWEPYRTANPLRLFGSVNKASKERI